MSKMTRRREVYTRKKSRGLGRRENFLQLYNRTCHRIYFYSFECCNNRRDAEMIMRDAFIYMFEHIAELRRSSSLDEWQHQCVEKAFRALLRSQLLMLTEDDTTYTPSSQLSESEKEEIWNRIIKMADIDPWRMVPIPGKSTIFSVLADQTISDLRYMTIGDIVKSVLMIIAMLAVAAAAIYFAVDYIKSRQDIAVDETQEIFLD
ncbi:MAG: sigma-70 family RNA polymerase sigma factor, partial [Clostridia bacterium]|nr:sigma-70 family RNA polymerase sigma factor [Clostridia bacterium]